MTAKTARLLVDGNGQIVPNQYYDSVTNSFIAGAGGTGISVGGTAVSSSNPLPVLNANAAPTDRSSTITSGGAAQVAMAALSTRKGYFFQNISSEIMWGSWVGTAAPNTAGSFPIQPNGILRNTTPCETTALSIYGATTGQKYTAWEM